MIGLYAHHHGAGHLTRCRAVAAALAPHHETVILSSHPDADVVLPPDAPAGPDARQDAQGALHWAPVGVDGHTERLAVIAAWIQRHRPAAFHVDLSVEVTAFVRLMGIPTTVQALPGIRDDAPHALGFRLADRIIAAWPDWVPLPAHLEPFAAKVRRVGGISRFDGRPSTTPRGRDTAILLGGGGQDGSPGYWRDVARLATEHLGGRARLLGLDEWVEDPFELLAAARLVISAAGQNSVADLAAAGARAVVLPQTRPFQEQAATARILAQAGLATVPEHPGLPALTAWPQLLQRALAGEPHWQSWQVAGAAQRAAGVVLEAARP